MKKILITLVLIIVANNLTAQDYKFGKVSKQELEETFYPEDSSANAAILYKKRRTYFDYSGNEGWQLITKVHERIKFYNKDGFDWGTKTIPLYVVDRKDEKVSIKATTYNIENGKVVKTKLSKNDIYKEKVRDNWESRKFTMPNLKDGSIVEWEYVLTSKHFFNIDQVKFQYEIPVKLVDAEVRIPEYFVFKYLPSNYYPIQIDVRDKNRKINYTYRSLDGKVGYPSVKTSSNSLELVFEEKVYSSLERNIPAIIKEPYINNINNYKSKISFELSSIEFPNTIPKYYNTTWEDVTKAILKNSRFGGQLNKTAYFKDDVLGKINITSTLDEKIIQAHEFVKNKIKWNGSYNIFTNVGVKNAYNDGVGNVAEINLVLIALLKSLNVNANPVLVSTRDHGIPMFPTKDGFNYVIACVETDTGIILLDATEEFSTLNNLPLRVLNWQGRLVREDGSSTWINLMPNNSSDISLISNIVIDAQGEVNGMNRVQYTNLNALNYRNKYGRVKDEDIISKIENKNKGIEISEFKILNKIDIYKPFIEMYKFSSEDIVSKVGDKIYFNPLLFNAKSENPFKLEKREYPIDFGTPFKEKNVLSIVIPEGYSVESVPESIAVGLGDNNGVYKFSVSVQKNKINVYSLLQINNAFYPTQDYVEIKEFYKIIINKNLESIVLKRI